MIRDDHGYPVYHGDNNAYDHHSRYPNFPTESVAQDHFYDHSHNRTGNFPTHRSHLGRMYYSSHPPHYDGRSYLEEPVNIVTGGPDPADVTSGMNLASPIPTSRARKRGRLGSSEDPSFLPPLPGDTGDRFDLLSSYSSSTEMHGEYAMKRRKHDSDGIVNAAYEGVGVLPHPASFQSYDQECDRPSWEDHPPSMSHYNTFADPYYQNHEFPGPIEQFHPYSPPGANQYPYSTHHQLSRKRTASTDDETPDNNEDAKTPESARIPPSLGQTSDGTCVTRTTGGERTSELKLTPSHRELEFLPNPRAKEALHVWYQRLGELVAFKNEQGHANVRQKYPPNPQLGIWVNKQRCTRSTLSKEKLEALEAVGFDWGTKKGEHAWQSKFNELLKYKKIHGDCK